MLPGLLQLSTSEMLNSFQKLRGCESKHKVKHLIKSFAGSMVTCITSLSGLRKRESSEGTLGENHCRIPCTSITKKELNDGFSG